MASAFYNQGKAYLTETLWESGNMGVLLLKSGSFNAGADFVSDLTPATNEADATNYVRKVLATPTATIDDADNRVDYDSADLTWTALGGASNNTIIAAVLYDNTTGADSTRRLIAFIDFPDTATNGGDFVLQWAATATLRVS
jgi:hypothetical protein